MQHWRFIGYVADSDDDDLELEAASTTSTRNGILAGREEDHGGQDENTALGRASGTQSDKENDPAWLLAVQRKPRTFSRRHTQGQSKEAQVVGTSPNESLEKDNTVTRQASPAHAVQIDGTELDKLKFFPQTIFSSEPPRSQHNAQEAADTLNSAASSPLSDAQSDASLPSPSTFRLHDPLGKEAGQDRNVPPPDMGAWTNNVGDSMTAPLRAFRTRTALQLHPYLIEQEKYRRTMRQGGQKPLRIAPSQEVSSIPVRRARPERYETSSEASRSQDSFLVSSQSQDPCALPTTSSDHARSPRVVEETSTPGTPVSKRRKVFHIPVITPRVDQLTDQQSSIPRTNQDTPPTSPPSDASRRGKVPQVPAGFQLPRARQMASKANFHGNQHRLVQEVSAQKSPSAAAEIDASISDGQIQPVSVSDVSGQSSSDSEVQFFSAKKRIKGVLPASWLRLGDKAAQRRDQRERSTLPARVDSMTGIVKGVAQRLTVQNRSPDKLARALDTFSDESDGPGPTETPVKPREDAHRSKLVSARPDVSLLYDSDQMEDNAIDPMFAAERRRPKSSSKHCRHQTKLATTSAPVRGIGEHLSRMSGRRSKPKRLSKTPQRRRQPHLSVIDLKPSSPDNRQNVPPFLRLAKRQARAMPDHGRHSPSHKAIRLATREDTADAMSTLTAWQRGDIAPRTLLPAEGPRRPATKHLQKRSLHDLMSRAHARCADAVSKPVGAPPPRKVASPRQSAVPLVRRGRLQHGPLSRQRFAPAQLETAASGFRTPHPELSTSIDQPRAVFALLQRRDNREVHASFQLQRYLGDEPIQGRENAFAESQQLQDDEDSQQPILITRKVVRKAKPRRLSVQIDAFRQPSEIAPVSRAAEVVQLNSYGLSDGLRGLDASDVVFPVEFDTRHLHFGTYFQSKSFLGSGDFADAMQVGCRDLGDPAGHLILRIDDTNTRWSTWTAASAEHLQEIALVISDASRYISRTSESHDEGLLGPMDTSTYLLRSLVRYISKCLHVEDLDSAQHFCEHATQFLEDVADTLLLQLLRKDAPANVRDHFFDCSTYLVTLAAQVQLINAAGTTVDSTQRRLDVVLRQLCIAVIEAAFGRDCQDIRTFMEKQNHHGLREAGANDNEVKVKTIIVINHVLDVLQLPNLTLDDLLSHIWKSRVKDVYNVSRLDAVWYDLLAIQPLMEIDTSGIYRPGSLALHGNGHACWATVKLLLSRTFDLYNTTPFSEVVRANQYLVAVLARIGVLISKWKWKGSEIVLAVCYDFFARRGLATLTAERHLGKYSFLKHLDGEPDLAIRPDDIAFQAFLKVLALGLKDAVAQYPVYKLNRMAFRFLPNHGRTYRKDQEVRQSDLDALRNHHDLLSTLFWALPPGSRSKLESLRDLVDFTNSHLEACRINIESWQNLAVFVMAHGDQYSEIASLGQWFQTHTGVLLEQYRLARSEAEELFDMAKDNTTTTISYNTMQMTVESNQRRILAILQQAVSSLRQAIEACSVTDRRHELIQESGLLNLCKIYDASQGRTAGLVQQVLRIVQTVLQHDTKQAASGQSEESQDYGDWTGIDELAGTAPAAPSSDWDVLGYLQPAVAQLCSNVLGSEQPADDTLLTSLTQVWSMLALQSVIRGRRYWIDYLDQHGALSWFGLPQTDAWRRQTPAVLAQLLQADPDVFAEHSTTIISEWLSSLAIPATDLRHQGNLTSAILDLRTSDPMLFNLPFARTAQGHHDISLFDLAARRSSLMSSVLLNIRTAVADARPSMQLQIKRSSTEIVRGLMAAMKQSFLRLADATLAARDPKTLDAFVPFLHAILASMQQHTVDLVPIDPFFNDPSVFPPPGNDPKYLIARLKGYVPRLGTEKGRKQLVIFLQTVISKSIREGDMDQVVQQLRSALVPSADDLKAETHGRSLRDVLTKDILSAYLSLIGERPSAGFFAAVVVRSLGHVFGNMDNWIDLTKTDVARREVQTISHLLQQTLSTIIRGEYQVQSPSHAYLKRTLLDAAHQLISPVEFVQRSRGEGMDAASHLEHIEGQCKVSIEEDTCDSADIVDLGEDWHTAMPLGEVAAYARQNLGDELSRSWAVEHGRLFYGNRTGKEEVHVPALGTMDDESAKLQSARLNFCQEMRFIMHSERTGKHGHGVNTDLADLCF